MSLFKFHDSNFLTVPNFPDIKAGAVVKNGYALAVANKTATLAPSTATEIFLALFINDKPEIKNTSDIQVNVGECVRVYNMKDVIGFEFDMSGDLVTGTPTTTNKYLIPNGDGTWKPVATAGLTANAPYFEIVKTNTFGSFITDLKAGYVVKACK